MPKPKIPVIFLIDAEPDELFTDRLKPVPWAGYKKAVEFLEEQRPRIEKSTGSPVKYSWGYRLDPQIAGTYGRLDWPITHYAEQFELLTKHNDAIGLHLHPYCWDEKIQGWISDFGNEAWLEKVVRDGVKTFKTTVGRGPEFFRWGERWMSDKVMNLLSELGVPCDLSLEPLHGPLASFNQNKPFTGFIPDQRDIPRFPYHPLRFDYRRPDPAKNDGIWEIPLSTAPLPASRLQFWSKPVVETANLFLSPRTIHRVIEDTLSRKAGYLAMVARADVFHREDLFKNCRASLDGLLRSRAARQFVFTSPAEALRMLAPEAAPRPALQTV